MKIKLDGFLCDSCGHKWYSQYQTDPARCAKCKSRAWNKSQDSPKTIIPSVRAKLEDLSGEVQESKEDVRELTYSSDELESP